VKTLAAGLATHYLLRTSTVARLLKFTAVDSAGELTDTVLAVTNHDRDLRVGTQVYSALAPAVDVGSTNWRDDMGQTEAQAEGVLTAAGFTLDDVESGVWDYARWELRECNWADTSAGTDIIGAGELGRWSLKDSQCQAELLDLFNRLRANLLDVVSPLCRYRLGSTECGVDMTSFTHTTTITAVESRAEFTASGLAQAADYFTAGEVEWLTGDNVGKVREVKAHPGSGVIELVQAMPYAIAVGDSIRVKRGCMKRHVEDCETIYSNGNRFGAEPFVPGLDRMVVPEE
jgi:uncharacterized phage protein (TIGR02218 family)